MLALLTRRRLVALAVFAAIVLGLLTLVPHRSTMRITAHFSSVVGLYAGSEVRLMGVPIGRVKSVTPGSQDVTVVLDVDSEYPLPADAKAIIVSPSVIADRFVQLAPVYPGTGPELRDGADIPESRTRVPVELDRIYDASHQLLTALGPKGANRNGALSDAVRVGARNLEGQGRTMHAMLHELGGALSALGTSAPDLYRTVDYLDRFSGMLAANDGQMRTFNRQLAEVSGFLAGEGSDLSAMLDSLSRAFVTVEQFVRRNRGLLVSNVRGLGNVAQALVSERAALAQLIEVAPVGLNNLNRTWDPAAQAVRTRTSGSYFTHGLSVTICDAFKRAGVPAPAAACAALHQVLDEATK